MTLAFKNHHSLGEKRWLTVLGSFQRDPLVKDSWLEKLGGSEAAAYREALPSESVAAPEDAEVAVGPETSASPSPVPVLPNDFFNQDDIKAALEEEEVNNGRFITENLWHQKDVITLCLCIFHSKPMR